jgi:deoxyribose-phosphate aldolase
MDAQHAGRTLDYSKPLRGQLTVAQVAAMSETKAFEDSRALEDGARELDMVINIGRLCGGQHADVAKDICAVVDVATPVGVLVKVIFENAYLTDDEKVVACRLTEEAGADFVKTRTGFAAIGASMHDLRLMRRSVGPRMQVKAAGARAAAGELRVP